MRGGGALLTTDLLSEWTDPDTAMEAVGNSLDLFDGVPSPAAAVRNGSPLRAELYDVLLRLVEGGVLEKRATADGRYAFRWNADLGEVLPDDASLLVAAHAAPPAPEPEPVAAGPGPEIVADDRPGFGQRLALQLAPLLLPTLSCVLVLLAFVWLDQSVALVIAGIMAVAGVVGVIRRVQLAAFWTVGLVIAGLLLRFS